MIFHYFYCECGFSWHETKNKGLCSECGALIISKECKNIEVEMTKEEKELKKAEEITIDFFCKIRTDFETNFPGVKLNLYHLTRKQKELDFMIDRWELNEKLVKLGKIEKNPYSKPAKNSQHLFGEAMDIHFYKKDFSKENRISDRTLIKSYRDYIYKKFKDEILQTGDYSWGIHIGMITERAKKFGLKKSIYSN